jgi:hypothetical protein
MGQFVYRHSGVRRISLRNEEFDKEQYSRCSCFIYDVDLVVVLRTMMSNTISISHDVRDV